MTPSIQPILKQLREAEKEITDRTWEVKENLGKDEAYCDWHKIGPIDMLGGKLNQNGRLIVLMRNNLIPLLDRIEELEDDVKLWKDRAYEAGYCPPLPITL